MSKYIHKSHNVSVLMYHIVCPVKYRKCIFDKKVEEELKNICLEIAMRYEIDFLEIGVDNDHVHFLVQVIPIYSPKMITQTIKSIIAREIFKRIPEVKKKLWGGAFWTNGYYISTVGKYGNENVISKYVKNQALDDHYKILHKDMSKLGQLNLF